MSPRRTGWSHPEQWRGHSKETSPPNCKANSAHWANDSRSFPALLRRCASLRRYWLPCFAMAMCCHELHTVQGKDPCREVPGLSRRSCLTRSTVEGLEKSSFWVIRITSTLEKSWAATPRLEFSEVQISITVPTRVAGQKAWSYFLFGF